MSFAYSLPHTQQNSFLTVFSALSWTIWKIRNDICFNNASLPTGRNTIILIISLVLYWTGNEVGQIDEAVQTWLPQSLENIPLRTFDGNEDLVLVEEAQRGGSNDAA